MKKNLKNIKFKKLEEYKIQIENEKLQFEKFRFETEQREIDMKQFEEKMSKDLKHFRTISGGYKILQKMM